MSVWMDIARRTAEATGPDREVDWIVTTLVDEVGSTYIKYEDIPRYSDSVDAVLALIAEKLPGCGVEIVRYPDGVMKEVFWMAELQNPGRLYAPGAAPQGDGATAALALLAAFCNMMGSRLEAEA